MEIVWMNAIANDGESTDVGFLLDVVFDHKMVWIQELLKTHGLSGVGTKPELRENVEGYLADKTLRVSALVDLVDRIEGWGDQHVYLYKAADGLLDELRDDKKVKETLRKRRCSMAGFR
jgi:hypothetical protein